MELSGITLHKLRIFQQVYEDGSLNRAAQELALSQSAVSQHVKGLERAVGVELFVRSAQGVRPTQVGDVLYRHSAEILARVRQMGTEISQLTGDNPQQLAICATPNTGAFLLPVWLGALRKQLPDVAVTIRTELTRAMVQAVLDQQVDFGVTVGDMDDLLETNLAQQTLSEVEYVVVVPPSHRFAGLAAIPLAELHRERFLTRRKASRSRQWLERVIGVGADSAEIDSPFAIKQAILNGMGISILPTYTVEREVSNGELTILGITNTPLKRPLTLLWNTDRPFNAIQTTFLQIVTVN